MNKITSSIVIFCFALSMSNIAVAQGTEAHKLVSQVTSDLLKVLKNTDESNEAALSESIENIVLPHIDFNAMSLVIFGRKNWNAASDSQKSGFIDAFRTLLLNTYAGSLIRFADAEIEMLPFEPHPKRPNRQAVVKSIISLGNTKLPLNYSLLYTQDNGWKVYDILIDEGIKLTEVYRNSFKTVLVTEGMDTVIQQIQAQNAKAQKS